jgi:hypothetical protein
MNSLYWSGDDGHGRYFRVADLRKGLDLYNEQLRQVCSREHVQVIDLSSMDGRIEYFYDDYHFNEAGAREVARLVAEGLAGHLGKGETRFGTDETEQNRHLEHGTAAD